MGLHLVQAPNSRPEPLYGDRAPFSCLSPLCIPSLGPFGGFGSFLELRILGRRDFTFLSYLLTFLFSLSLLF